MKLMNDSFGCCLFNKEVDCAKKDKCKRCGWNPEVDKERRKIIREKYERKK